MERLTKVGAELGVKGLEEPLLGMNDQEEEFPEGEDPYLSLGYGMVAYFHMLKVFIMMWSLFTILVIPVIYIYAQYTGLRAGVNFMKTQFSLGNMGFTTNTCKHTFTSVDGDFSYTCQTGYILNVTSVGILPALETENTKEMYGDYIGFCGRINDMTEDELAKGKFSEVKMCHDAIEKKALVEHFQNNCMYRNTCAKPFNQNSLKPATLTPEQEVCWKSNSIFYLQYECRQFNTTAQQAEFQQGIEADADYVQPILDTKRHQALIVSCIGILISLLYITCLYYLAEIAKIEFKEWDVNTVTASDFTVEWQIPKSVWQKFEDGHADKKDSPEGSDFEAYLKKSFEELVSAKPSVLRPDEPPSPVTIANITFAFNNAKLLHLLQERGTAVASGMFKNLPEVDKKINELKKHEANSLTKPVSAFITFETQDGYERACEFEGYYNWKGELIAENEFDGAGLYFNEAPEPTNIIWEHRQITRATQLHRTVIVTVVIIFLLILAFFAFLFLKQATVQAAQKYPAGTNCQEIYEIYHIDSATINADTVIPEAFVNSARDDEELINTFNTGTGVYQCFCKLKSIQLGAVQFYNYKEPLCTTFLNDFVGGQALAQFVSVSIIIINIILKMIMLVLVKWIGYHTESEQTSAIMYSIFVTQFFNTGILLILTNANTIDAGLFFLPFKGMYNDLNAQWYDDIGASFIITMLTAAMMPIAELCIAVGMQTAFQFLDRGFSFTGNSTKTNTIQAYINLYAGPEYDMHVKYSALMNMLFVCFMYGLAIPLLFPISLVGLTVLYFVEKFAITYFYRKPPMFDEKMNTLAITTLQWAPVYTMFFGYWCLSNVQLFTNTTGVITSTLVPAATYHSMFSFSVNQALPLMICGIFIVFLVGFDDLSTQLLIYIGVMSEDEEAEVDEGLGTYWECLDEHDRLVWYLDETHLRKQLGITTIDEDAYNLLKDGKPGKKQMRTTPNYEIVTNSRYAEKFQYVPIDFRDTEEEKENANMVAKILNLAYVPESEHEAFQFRTSKSRSKKTGKVLKTTINEAA